MTTQNNPVDYFIDLVEKLRKAQRDFAETESERARLEIVKFEKMVDAWIVARRLDERKLAAWVGQKEN